MDILIVILVVGTSIWVLIDAKKIGVKPDPKKGFLNMGPWGWFFSCLLLWLIAFPLYLIKRKDYGKSEEVSQGGKRKEEKNSANNKNSTGSPIVLGLILILILVGPSALIANLNSSEDPQEPSTNNNSKVENTFEVKFVDAPDGLNLRNSPSVSSEILDTLKDRREVKVMEEEGKWSKVETDTKMGWVSGNYLVSELQQQEKKVFQNGDKQKGESNSQQENVGEDQSESDPKPEPEVAIGKRNALRSAKTYLDNMAFSREGLIEQLVQFEGFTQEQAEYGVNNSGANWNKQAAKAAKDYLDYTAFSREGLIEQLVQFEGFTKEQAEYGVEAVGY